MNNEFESRSFRGRCVDCAERLAVTRKLLGKRRCSVCEASFAQEVRKAEDDKAAELKAEQRAYSEVLVQIVPGIDLEIVAQRIVAAREATNLTPGEVRDLDDARVSKLLTDLTKDGSLDPTEDRWLNQVIAILGTPLNDQFWKDFLLVALDSGLILRDASPPAFLVRPDEVIHFHCVAANLETTPTQELEWSGIEMNAGTSGKAVGSAISKGRARIITTGTETARTDTGPLVVTSDRVLFLGERGTLEVSLDQLAGVKVLPEKVRLQVANRPSSPMFEVGSPGDAIVATVVLTSAKRKMGLLKAPPPSVFPPVDLPPVPDLLVKSGYSEG